MRGYGAMGDNCVGGGIGFAFPMVVGWAEGRRKAGRLNHACALLHHMGQLMGEQPASRGGQGMVLALGKINVLSGGERPCADSPGSLVGRAVRMDADTAEVSAKVRLEVSP